MDPLWSYLFFTAWPLYVANATAMVFAGKTRIDYGIILKDQQPLFGAGKTWKGAGMGILLGSFAGFLAEYFFPTLAMGVSSEYLYYAIALSAGAILGDLAGSFIKRRMRIPRGEPAHLLDQLDFVVGGLFLGIFFLPNIHVTGMLVLVMITPFMHLAFNRIAYIFKIKNVPW